MCLSSVEVQFLVGFVLWLSLHFHLHFVVAGSIPVAALLIDCVFFEELEINVSLKAPSSLVTT
jgi:hypothetical protein